MFFFHSTQSPGQQKILEEDLLGPPIPQKEPKPFPHGQKVSLTCHRVIWALFSLPISSGQNPQVPQPSKKSKTKTDDASRSRGLPVPEQNSSKGVAHHRDSPQG
ncbi:hypothetical protein JTE90_022390 [Oedothorax gibbosus]|uniref:Uncharacterized protein n=1 Tax=Oedothorax gibbosus TaxID=931172 RepID=A0AAV6TPN4_9ARAC|nr:hypothetical protein JTE90_022390 [Oedothorax gibbosus]